MRREYEYGKLYEDVEHLRFVNTKINTGLVNEPTNEEIKLQFKVKVNYYSSSKVLAVSSKYSGLQVYSNGGRMFNQSAAVSVTSGSVKEFETTTTYTRRTVKIIGGISQTQDFTRSITDGEDIIFGNGYPDDIYYMKIYINGILRRDFVPKKRLSDGVYGFLDLVENEFYTGDGEGYITI